MCLELLCNARRCVISIRARLAQLPVAPNILVLCAVPQPPHIPATHYHCYLILCCWEIWKHCHEVVFRQLSPSLPWPSCVVAQPIPQRTACVATAWRSSDSSSRCNWISCCRLLYAVRCKRHCKLSSACWRPILVNFIQVGSFPRPAVTVKKEGGARLSGTRMD
jgi:hypothetical protein